MAKPPFHSFSFTLIQNKRPRVSFRMMLADDAMYELNVQKGSSANPSSQFTRRVPLDSAERLRDALQDLGVFGWEQSYGDTIAPGTRRWTLSVVFEKDVFSIESKGGSDAPNGFDGLLEELYRLDFPRPSESRASNAAQGVGSAINSLGMGSFGRMSAGDLGAYAATGNMAGIPGMPDGFDMSQMADALTGNMPGFDMREMQELLSQAQGNPRLFEQRMKEEFRHLSPAEQNQMLDALAASGLATREWWKRFFGL